MSDLFRGGKTDWIYSICGLAAAYNGTTLHVNHQAVTAIETRCCEKNGQKYGALPAWTRFLPEAGMHKIAYRARRITSGNVALPDTGLYDMHPDHSVLMNERIRMVPDIYYFSVPFDATRSSDDGSYRDQDRRIGDPFFTLFVHVMGNTDTVTMIDGYAFLGCGSLTGIAIPEGVTGIGDYAYRRKDGVYVVPLGCLKD